MAPEVGELLSQRLLEMGKLLCQILPAPPAECAQKCDQAKDDHRQPPPGADMQRLAQPLRQAAQQHGDQHRGEDDHYHVA